MCTRAFLAVVALCSSLLSLSAQAAERQTLNFNPDWKFIKADPAGASEASFDDSSWSTISTPHTYNDIDTFDHWSTPGHRGEIIQWSGRTWYRKTFTMPESFQGKKVFIEFEAARQFAEVYLNGHYLGVCRNGFIPFGFDLTPYLRFGAQPNVLAVMCDNRFMKDPMDADISPQAPTETMPNLLKISQAVNSSIPDDVEKIQADQIPWNNPHWHPAHGGIYRNIRLYVTDPLHISLPLYSFLQTTGPYVYATEISDKSAQLHVEVPIQNERSSAANTTLHVDILDAEGKSVLTLEHSGAIAAGGHDEFDLAGEVANPRLWQPSHAYLYRVVCSLRVGGEVVDTDEIHTGIRTVHWDARAGFFINGRHTKLRGWGQKPTDEWPGLGAAQPEWMHFYTLKLMKDAGANWVRWGHCAGSPGMLDAGDRLGIMAEQPGVDGESDTVGAAWKIRAAAFRDMVIYYRNHPSIMIWEGGNQKVTSQHAKELRGYMDQYDPHGGRAYAHRRADKNTAKFMDVCIGTEGGHEIGRLPVVEGEYDREESPRRVWDNYSPPNFGYPEAKGQAYQLTSEQYAVDEISQFLRKIDARSHCGGANWIFSDTTSGGRVACEVARAGGEVDGVRLPKEAYYACAALFSDHPQLHIIGHWNYPPGTKKTVYVVSNCRTVELFVNGKSLGHGQMSGRRLFTFPNVAWEPGVIKAVGSKKGKPVLTDEKHTVGPPAALRLTAMTGPGGLHADGSDIALIDVEAVDKNGDRCPTFQQRVDFKYTGPCIWRGGYNSGKINSINNPWLDLECGINRVSVRSTLNAGSVTVTATCPGLASGSITVDSKPIELTDGCVGALPPVPQIPIPVLTDRIRADWAHIEQLNVRLSEPGASQMIGRYTINFSYSGPTGTVHVEQQAHSGKNVYVDRDISFPDLPAELRGADWIQAGQTDAFYSAVDLMQIEVGTGTVVYVAHDDTLTRPRWLVGQFKQTQLSLTVNGRPMKLFTHETNGDESLTLGSNTHDPRQKTGNMYIVFVNIRHPETNAGDESPSAETGAGATPEN